MAKRKAPELPPSPSLTPIHTLLIANRGEIARRVQRTCREMGIRTIAVFAEGDRDAPFAREADVAIALGGQSAADTYLDVAKLLDAAARTGANAIHPGYGFLSESAPFARAVIEAGLVWVGPQPKAIAAMGDKVAAKRGAEGTVPILPSVTLSWELLQPARLWETGQRVGFPLLVKAAFGGGGRGMRVVRAEAELEEAVAGAMREAAAAFGDGTVFLERYVELARHVEVQVFGDRHGNLAHLFERECSIQRRHQKLIEEAPSPAVGPELRERMGAAAVAMARAIDYDSAGTVEFLLDASGHFSFLEMNTRLQVEHPVTEAITGLDLVREQIRVAEGHPLSFRQDELRIAGHAIEARVYAEDPARGFLPGSGTVRRWRPDPAVPLRVDSGVESGSDVTVHFDALLAKLIAHAPTRDEAARRLAIGLERLQIDGPVTNRDFLVNVLRHPAFVAGETSTEFIEREAPALERAVGAREVAQAALAAALAAQAERRASAPVLQTIPTGWRSNPSQPQWAVFLTQPGDAEVRVEYTPFRDGSFAFVAGELSGDARLRSFDGGRLTLETNGELRAFEVLRDGAQVSVHSVTGQVRLRELPRFPEHEAESVPGGYEAPLPGRVVRVHVAAGAEVAKGDLLLTLDAMKMEHRIIAAEAGTIAEVRVGEGDQVEGGQVLVVLTPREQVQEGAES